jgi:hypothetical protein
MARVARLDSPQINAARRATLKTRESRFFTLTEDRALTAFAPALIFTLDY